MSNFTRSIAYSTTVLVAGVVAIFTIYSNVSTYQDAKSVADISPAAGVSNIDASIDTDITATKAVAEFGGINTSKTDPVNLGIEGTSRVAAPAIEEITGEIEIIEDAIESEEEIEKVYPKHNSINKRMKGSSGPHMLPEKSGALQTPKYLILAGGSNTPKPNVGDLGIGDIGDIIEQAQREAQERAGQAGKKGKTYSKRDKKRLLRAMNGSNFAERKKKGAKNKKPQMTQQAFIMQQALQTAAAQQKVMQAKKSGRSLTKTVSLTSDSSRKALVSTGANALAPNFTQMAQGQVQPSQQQTAAAQAGSGQAAQAATAAQQLANQAAITLTNAQAALALDPGNTTLQAAVATAQQAVTTTQQTATTAAQFASTAQNVSNITQQGAQNALANVPISATLGTIGVSNIIAQAKAATANIPGIQLGVLTNQAITTSQTIAQQSWGNIKNSAMQSASGSIGIIQQISTSGITPEAAKTAAKNLLIGQISSGMNNAGFGSMMQTIKGGFATAIGGDMDQSTILALIIQVGLSLPQSITSKIPGMAFAGSAINVLSSTGASMGGFNVTQVINTVVQQVQ